MFRVCMYIYIYILSISITDVHFDIYTYIYFESRTTSISGDPTFGGPVHPSAQSSARRDTTPSPQREGHPHGPVVEGALTGGGHRAAASLLGGHAKKGTRGRY